MRSSTPTLPHSHTPTLTSRWWDLPAAFLLLIALSTAANRLVATKWTDHLYLIQALTLLGVLVGLALGQSSFSSLQAAAFALLYSLFFIPWLLGGTLGAGILWTERLVSLVGRLVVALGQLARQEAVSDHLFFLSLMAILFWTLAVYAGYNLTRHARPWRAILPAGLVLLNIQINDPFAASRVWFLASYLFFGILLLARLTYLRHHARWRQNRVPLCPYAGFDMTRTALLVTILLVLVAWNMPVLVGVLPSVEEAWQYITRPWTIVRERVGETFAPLRRTVGLVNYYAYYDERFSLGRGSELSKAPIMTVKVSSGPATSIRYYWRARVYDHYAGGQWTSTFTATQSVAPTNFDLTFSEIEGRSMATFDFSLAVPIATLYTASQPLWVSRPAQVELAYNPDGTADLSALHADRPLRAGETYQARSSLNTATIAQLRTAGTDYPVWVTDRYLQVPSSVTTRTLELARQIARDLDNPYDIAAAVTAYLRTNISYSDTIPSPPPDQEPLDWFLFDLRQGFCGYYASAEVILLRSLGIPARPATGFAQGERQEEGDTYLVRHHDAHAWPEVYFPGLGWVEFEPTASQSAIHRSLGESPTSGDVGLGPIVAGDTRMEERDRLEELMALDGGLLSEPPATTPPRSHTPILFCASLLILGLLSTSLAWRASRRRGLSPLPILLEEGLRRLRLQPPAALRRWARHTALSPLARAYLELDHALARLDAPPAPADTPAERVAVLTGLLPEAAGPAQRLLGEYQTATYSPHPGNLHVAQEAARAVRSLSWRAIIRRFTGRWRESASSSRAS